MAFVKWQLDEVRRCLAEEQRQLAQLRLKHQQQALAQQIALERIRQN